MLIPNRVILTHQDDALQTHTHTTPSQVTPGGTNQAVVQTPNGTGAFFDAPSSTPVGGARVNAIETTVKNTAYAYIVREG